MALDRKNVYSFDNCSILNQCEVILPEGLLRMLAGRATLCAKNQKKLQSLSGALVKQNIPRYRFEPVNWNDAMIKFGNSLLAEFQYVKMLDNLRAQIIIQLEGSVKRISEDFQGIEKDAKIGLFLKIFKENIRTLHKGRRIPDKEDCEILAGLDIFSCQGIKHIVSEDEDFWGYKDVIGQHWGIKVVEEWNCQMLTR